MMYKGALKLFAFCHSWDFKFVQPLAILTEPAESNTISFGRFTQHWIETLCTAACKYLPTLLPASTCVLTLDSAQPAMAAKLAVGSLEFNLLLTIDCICDHVRRVVEFGSRTPSSKFPVCKCTQKVGLWHSMTSATSPLRLVGHPHEVA